MRAVYLPNGLPVDYSIQLANALSKNEDMRTMIILFNTPETKEHLADIDTRVKTYVSRATRHPFWHPGNVLVLMDIMRAIRGFKPDLIHLQVGGWDLPTLSVTLLAMFIKRYRLVATFHDARPHLGNEDAWIVWTRKWLVNASGAIFVHGKQQKALMIRHHNVDPKKVHAITMGEHNVNPLKRYQTMEVTPDENFVLFFGWIAVHKGLEYLVKSEPLIHKTLPDVRIVIAGREGSGRFDRNYLERCRAEMVNRRNFEIHNHYINWRFGAELFQKASVVVLPYVEATQSGVVPVAYAFKKPVVVTDVGALREIVDNGKTGLIVRPADPEGLAKAIIKLLKDKKLAKEMGEAGYRKLKTDMSWDIIGKATVEVYEKVLDQTHRDGQAASRST